MTKNLLWFAPMLVLLAACSHHGPDNTSVALSQPPLADTLVTILRDLQKVALSNRPEELLGFLDSAEARRLTSACRVYGASALSRYLQARFDGWPDPDTLYLADFTLEPPYARITLAGGGAHLGDNEERVRFTFLLFRKVKTGWRLAFISTLDKKRYDCYGTELSFLETELPPDLRFPRLF